MCKLITKRILLLLLRVFILSFVLFFFLMPGINFREFVYWYWQWLRGIFTGNFGWSWRFNQPVIEVIGMRLPNTLGLVAITLLIIYGIGIPLGIISGRNHDSWKDRAILVTTQIGTSFPSFTLALIFIIFFALSLRWFPHRGSISIEMVDAGWVQYHLARLHHVILPAFSLAIVQLIMPMKYLRGGIIDTMKQSFILTARAKGVTEKDVFKKHVFKNSLPALIATFPIQLAAVLSGAIIIEAIFMFPGLGDLVFIAFRYGDFGVTIVLALIFGITIMLLSIIADVLLMKLDPRIEFEKN